MSPITGEENLHSRAVFPNYTLSAGNSKKTSCNKYRAVPRRVLPEFTLSFLLKKIICKLLSDISGFRWHEVLCAPAAVALHYIGQHSSGGDQLIYLPLLLLLPLLSFCGESGNRGGGAPPHPQTRDDWLISQEDEFPEEHRGEGEVCDRLSNASSRER